MKIRRDVRVYYMVAAVFAMVFLFVFLRGVTKRDSADVDAVSAAGFDPGYIISDYQMGNYKSMTEKEIQKFLDSKVSCNKDKSYYDFLKKTYPGFTWHYDNGHIVCMNEELFGDGETIGKGETAAHIIWQAAQDYKINPQVLIVLLEKEQGLITDNYPNNVQYRAAAGYGCPDTAACSSKYYGFKNQVRNAAELFSDVLNGGWSNYQLGNNYIQYNPNAACGGSIVNIRSLATAALYRYTPYQPNASALAAGYGTGDSCGAYGNRNFYLYFQEWFGGITDGSATTPESTKIIEGEYIIQSALTGNVVMDVAGEAVAAKDGTNVQIYGNNETSAQRWMIENTGDGAYIIKNLAANKVLDVAGGSKNNGANVQMYQSNDTDAQKWKIVANNDGTYYIYSVLSGMVIDVSGASNKSGTNVQMYAMNESKAQKWKLIPAKTVEDGEYVISGSKKILEAINGGKINGTNVRVYQQDDASAQKWEVKYGNDGYYMLTNVNSKKALDVANGGKEGGANIQIYQADGTCAQKWQIVETKSDYLIYSACSDLPMVIASSGTNVQLGEENAKTITKWTFAAVKKKLDGKYIIESAVSKNMVLDVVGAGTKDGTNIQLYTKNNTDAQKWEVTEVKDGVYSILNVASKKSLDVAGAGIDNGTNIQLYNHNKTCAQEWIIEESNNGMYDIRSNCSKKSLDVAGAGTKDGTNIQLYEYNGTAAQKWILNKI